MAALVQVILAGGSGSRLWPVSRTLEPKQFMRVDGTDSLLQASLRLAQALQPASILTSTTRDLYFATRDQYLPLGLKPEESLFQLEPQARNTLAPIVMAALFYQENLSPDTVLLVSPADHVIYDLDAYANDVAAAKTCAEADYLVTFGIPPQYPATGYGYIKKGQLLDHLENTYAIEQFKEKPDLATAETFYQDPNYLWNAGIFCFKASTLLNTLAKLHPKWYQQFMVCWLERDKHLIPYELPISFNKLPNISLDYAIMEQASNVALVPAHFSWSDVGSWSSIADLQSHGSTQNIVEGAGLLLDSENCFIRNSKRFIAGVGLKNTIIVDTDDALLVLDKSHSEAVKKVLDALPLESKLRHSSARTTRRPWGSYEVIQEGPGFKIKQIRVDPGAALSLQFHNHRSEHWVVLAGVARVINGNKEFLLNPNQHTHIPVGHKHRLSNPGSQELIIIEIQTGSYLEEDDIVRLNDDYGRAQKQNAASPLLETNT